MTLARMALALAVTGGIAAGCGGGSGKSSRLEDVRFDVGGRVLYLMDPDRPLSGVLVTLTDVDGDTKTAETAENGLWTATNLPPGPWVERFELAGYEPVERRFILSVDGANDIANVFEGRPDALLQETLLRTTTAPFGVQVRDAETIRDGFERTLQYSVTANGGIVITFDAAVIDADADLRDGETASTIFASFDSVAGTLTFAESDIDGMNGSGLTTDTDTWTWHRIRIFADRVTPLNGELDTYFATLYFNAVP